MTKTACKILITVFSLFIIVFSLLFIFMPKREFSEQENRYLSSAPEFTLKSLFSGEFTQDFEKFLSDQFPFRDEWITFKAASELVSGKTQNNGIYYCGDDTLIEGFDSPDIELLNTNIDAVNELVENADCEVYFQLVPTSAEIWRSKLPAYAQSADQTELINYCYANTHAVPVDIVSRLSEHADEYIYYRTDHHWTTLGAYYGYMALAETMGFSPSPLDSFSRITVSDSFFGTTYSSSGFSWVRPDTIETFIPETTAVSVTNYPHGSPEPGYMYDESFLEKKDKYSMFYGGNTPLLQIETGPTEKGTLLVIRDSYADCFTPFLYDEFSTIYQMDLRYYKTSLHDFITDNEIDSILLCYSTKSFMTDTSLFLLGQ